MKKYSPSKIEPKWQKIWQEKKIFQAKEKTKKPKFYVLDMFPYPSGAGLHVGHLKGYIATDIIAKMKMMQGFNVLHPMGWDAFGLPAENYALKHKIHPQKAIAKNIKNFKRQIKMVGLGYDWQREINTTDPQYYKWTQWIFLQLYKKGLAYLAQAPVNWCPGCQTVLANEDVEERKCERCGTFIERKKMKQWMLKMTAFAERLLKDLKLLDWEKSILEQQKNWIGKSEGAIVKFLIYFGKKIKTKFYLEVFTTRLDTIFGATYLVLAPEHPLIEKLKSQILNFEKIKEYIKKAEKKSDLERTDLLKEKTGIKIEGILAKNPFNQKLLPVFVADYVLPYYAKGAIMGVPAHDERDYEFAKKYGLKIKKVIQGSQKTKLPFVEDGILINSGKFSALDSKKARKKLLEYGRKKGFCKKAVFYKMHDWVFSRQRYWGEPIPIVFCENCYLRIKKEKKVLREGIDYTLENGKKYAILPLNEKDLPLKLPQIKYYQPTGTGKSPLANIKSWVETKCPVCKNLAFRETNTMPQWAGSCWYYLRYLDPKNKKELVLKEKEKYWLPVDLYVGGAEHATRHLLYARFWHKFLYDLKIVSSKEPFKKLKHVGLILGEDGRKMSKRWGNVINPEKVIKKYGADAMRLYEMFMGPFDQPIAWKMEGVVGMRRFLERVWNLIQNSKENSQKKSLKIKRKLHQTIKKVSQDIEDFKFNTAISALIEFVNETKEQKYILKKAEAKVFLKLLAPFAPHIAEELWQALNKKGKKRVAFKSIFQTAWPKYDPKLAQKETFVLVVQIDGKIRDKIKAPFSLSEKEAKALALKSPKIKKWLKNKKIKKTIFVFNRLINFVTL